MRNSFLISRQPQFAYIPAFSSGQGQPAPRHLPKHRKHGSQIEEQRLRAMGPEVAAYVDYALRTRPLHPALYVARGRRRC
jgi:hypothetical protein